MRSIHTIKSGDQGRKDYYTKDESLNQGKGKGKGNSKGSKDYYGEEEIESASESMSKAVWFGKDAERLELVGHAEQADFEQIFDGYIPGTQQRIRGRKPRDDHQENCIYDVVLTCKKSVSMQIHLGKDERLYKAYQETVKEIAELIEQDYAQARIQVDGERCIVQTSGIIALMIPHHTSRDGDMNVHTHLAIANGTYCPDGKWRSLLDRGFSHAYYMGDYFSARLAARVQALGYEIRETVTEQGHPSWELAGYTDEQIKVFSKRSQSAKVKELVAAGMSRDDALLRTRRAKEIDETLEEAQERWSEEAQLNDVQPIIPHSRPVKAKFRANAKSVLESAIRHYSHQSNHFTRDQIREYAFKLNRTFTIAELDREIAAHPSLVDYGEVQGVDELKGHFTTVEAMEREIRTVTAWRQGQGQATPILRRSETTQALAHLELKSGQREAIIGVLASSNRHQIIHGLSGVGKTTALRHLKSLTDQQGVEVLGFAPSLDAAKKLSDELGIATHSVQHLVKSERLTLKPNQLLLIDEAGMVSAEMLDVVLAKANTAGARVLLVGDTGQNQAIEAGSPMRSLMEHGAETHHIAEILRQQNSVQRQAVELIAKGNGLDALSLLHEHDYVNEIADRDQRVEAIATDFLALSAEEQNNTLIVTGTNDEKDAITAHIRAGLKAEGRLGDSQSIIQLRDRALTPEEAKEILYYRVGDYVVLAREYRGVPLHRDIPYQVVGSAEEELVVASPGGRLYRFDPQQCRDKQVFASHEIDVAVGDSLRWTASNRDMGHVNGKTFRIVAIEGKTATLLTDDGMAQLDLSQPFAVDYTLTSTSYRVQGSDRPRVFVSATNDPTSNREPFYVSISRQIKDLKIWTQDYEALKRRVVESSVQRNPLELLGYGKPNRNDSADRLAADSSPAERTEDQLRHFDGLDRSDSRNHCGADQGTAATTGGQEQNPASRGIPHRASGGPDRGTEGGTSEAGLSERLARRTAELQEIAAHVYHIRLERELTQPLSRLRDALEELRDTQRQVQQKDADLTERLQDYLSEAKLEVINTTLKHWRSLRRNPEADEALKGIPAQTAVQFAMEDYYFTSEQFIDMKSIRKTGVPVLKVKSPPQEEQMPTTTVGPPKAKPKSKPTPTKRTTQRTPAQRPTKKQPVAVFWQPVYPDKAPSHLEARHWEEMQRSRIHPEIITLNSESVSGQEVYERLLSERLAQLGSGQFVTQPMARLMAQYEQVAEGGWWGKAGIDAHSLVNLQPGERPHLNPWGCFKADNPRIDQEKSARKGQTEVIKYENPLGVSRSLYLPLVPDTLAERIYEKHGVQPTDAERQSGFWCVVYRHNLPVMITEGAKKTWASLSQGEITIGMSGVNGVYRAKDADGNLLPNRQLNEELAVFATPGREFRFAYDQDTKASTVRNVRRDMVRGIELLEQRGCTCRVVQWRPEHGKGLDDLIANQGPQHYTEAILEAQSADKAKRTHYRTEYNTIARAVRTQYPDAEPELLDAEVYLRAIAKGELSDGERFIREGDQARSLAQPDQVEAYVNHIKTHAGAIRHQQQALEMDEAQAAATRQQDKAQYESIAQSVREELGAIPVRRIDMEVCLKLQEQGTDPEPILRHFPEVQQLQSPEQVQAYLNQLKADAPHYQQQARDRAEYLSLAKFARHTMGEFPDKQLDLHICVSVGIDGAEADRILAQSDTALALDDPARVQQYIEGVKTQIPQFYEQRNREAYDALVEKVKATHPGEHNTLGMRLDAHVYKDATESGEYTPQQIDQILSHSKGMRSLTPDERNDYLTDLKQMASRPSFGKHHSERGIAMTQQAQLNQKAVEPFKWIAKNIGKQSIKDGSYTWQEEGYAFFLKDEHLKVTRRKGGELVLEVRKGGIDGSVTQKELDVFKEIIGKQSEHLTRQKLNVQKRETLNRHRSIKGRSLKR